MTNEYQTKNKRLSLPDGQVDITLCLSRGLLRDAFAKSFKYTASNDGFIQGAKQALYELHFDIRDILGLHPRRKLDFSKLTDEQEAKVADVVVSQLSRLRDLNLEVEINYTTRTHRCFVAISGDGLKELTMAKVIETITATD